MNTKATRRTRAPEGCRSVCLSYELQRDPAALVMTLQSAARQLGATADDWHAITMTAELSQAFRSKREGVAFVLDALEATFPRDRLHVYTVTGQFVSPSEARQQPLEVAASNWSATAHWLATFAPTCMLVDIGTTTTDLIPIVDGRVSARGRTDLDRLGSGELVYTAVLRTPVETVAPEVVLRGRPTGLAAEGFALMGDVYLWRGALRSEDYTCPTPDGRPATRRYAGERLARAVCADGEMLGDEDIDQIAAGLWQAQLRRISEALLRLRQEHTRIELALVTGLGAFLGSDAARAAGLGVELLSERSQLAPQAASSAAVASLLDAGMAIAR